MIDIGFVRISKGGDSPYWLFAVDLTDVPEGHLEPEGLEHHGWVEWTDKPWQSPDPLMAVMWTRFRNQEILMARIAARHCERRIARELEAKAFHLNVGDPVLYGKYKNKRGIIVGFGEDEKKNVLDTT